MKKFMLRSIVAALAILMIVPAAFGQTKTALTLWTQAGATEPTYLWLQTTIAEFQKANPSITIDLVQKDTEALREDFINASIAGQAPDFVWTVSDHAGPFTAAKVIRPVDDLYKPADFVESIKVSGKTYAIPVSSGNHLMLLYNKKFVAAAPTDTNALIKAAKDAQTANAGVTGLTYNQTEPFWLAPWLGGFKGKVFAADGVTPTLNTKEMVATLQFLYDLKYKEKITPQEADYAVMDTTFKEGKTAMIINGDWSLADYQKALGSNLGVAALPKVSATGAMPAPYTSGKYIMISAAVRQNKIAAIKKFVDYLTSPNKQLEIVYNLNLLPARKATLASAEKIKFDPILAGSAAQLSNGTPMPTVNEMRAVWDAMKPEMNKVLAGQETPADAAKAMQAAAEAGIKQQKQ